MCYKLSLRSKRANKKREEYDACGATLSERNGRYQPALGDTAQSAESVIHPLMGGRLCRGPNALAEDRTHRFERVDVFVSAKYS